MAIDEAMLRYSDQDPRPLTTLRLYTWQNPTVSIGYAQKAPQAVNLDFCAEHGIDVVRRPTGGRAVLHAEELTYAFISNDTELFGGNYIQNTYLKISQILFQALTRIGCPASISPGNPDRGKGGSSAGADSPSGIQPHAMIEPCFISTSRFEITAGNRKLVGSAQRRLKRAFLQHGSILIHCDYARHAASMSADVETLRRSFVGIGEYLPASGIEAQLRQIIPQCAEEVLGISIMPGNLVQEESLAALHYEQSGRYWVGEKS